MILYKLMFIKVYLLTELKYLNPILDTRMGQQSRVISIGD